MECNTDGICEYCSTLIKVKNDCINFTELNEPCQLQVKLAGITIVNHEDSIKHLLDLQSSMVWIKMWKRHYPKNNTKQPYVLCSLYKRKVGCLFVDIYNFIVHSVE